MLALIRRWTLAVAVLAPLVPLVLAPSAASASSTPAIVKTIVSAGDTYVNEIRNVFFCTTKTCLAQRTQNLKLAQDGMAALDNEAAGALVATLPAPYTAPVKLFVNDDRLLSHAFTSFSKDSTKIAAYVDLGTIEFSTAALASDTAVLAALAGGHPVKFRFWAVGVSAMVYVLQTDLNSFAAPKNTGPEALAIAQHLVVDAAALEQHANGPSAPYNALVKKLASDEGRVAGTEVLKIQHQKAPLTTAQVLALNVAITKDITALANLQNTLAKA